MTANPQPDRLDDLRTEYANTGMVKYDGAVWLISQVVVLREHVQQLAAEPVSSPPATRAADRAAAPVKQRADCTELEWAEQERARFERLYTRETVRADQAEDLLRVAHETSNRSEAERARAVQRAERAEAERDSLGRETDRLRKDWVEMRTRAERAEADRAAVLREAANALAAVGPEDSLVSGPKAWNEAVTVLRRLAVEAQQPEPVVDLIEDYLRFLRGQGPEPDLSDLPLGHREAITGQFEIVRALADRDPSLPPLDRDPVARRLGLHPTADEAQQQPDTETQAAPSGTRETIEYFLQAQQDDGTWESASSFMDALDWATKRLAAKRAKYPEFTWRMVQRTTTVVVQPVPDCLACRHWRCDGDGPCGALLDSWQRCTCLGPPAASAGVQTDEEANRG